MSGPHSKISYRSCSYFVLRNMSSGKTVVYEWSELIYLKMMRIRQLLLTLNGATVADLNRNPDEFFVVALDYKYYNNKII